MNALPRIMSGVLFFSSLIPVLLALFPSTDIIAQQRPAAAAPAQPSLQPSNNNVVVLDVAVTDRKNGYAWGLTKDNFILYDGKAEQQITFFEGKDNPSSIGILLDASGSINIGMLKAVREGLARFFYLGQSSNDYFLLGFNERPQLLLDWTRSTTAILNKIATIDPERNTALYDGCYLGLEKVTHGAHPKHVLLLITDGQDTSSLYDFQELRRALKESDVLIYAVGFMGTYDSTSSLSFEGRIVLDELATITGGKAYYPVTAEGVNTAFEMIALELRRQYRIGFVPAADGKWHEIKVKVKPPPNAPREFERLSARSRAGYQSVVVGRSVTR